MTDEPIWLDGSSGSNTHSATFNCPECDQEYESELDADYMTDVGEGNSLHVECAECGFEFRYVIAFKAYIEDMNGNTLEEL